MADPRLNPGLVKLFDTILQSLEQMRTLSIVDESPELVPLVEGKLAFSKARRCVAGFNDHTFSDIVHLNRIMYLARTYSYLEKYAEALALTAKAHIYIREAQSLLSTSTADASGSYPVTPTDISTFERELASDELKTKMDWYAYNGGKIDALGKAQPSAHKKPVFFDVAFNYVELPMDRLLQRAGKAPAPSAVVAATGSSRPGTAAEEKEKRSAKLEMEEAKEKEEVKAVETRASSGFSGILGGWWGRK